jgi:hypothetical protein
MQRREKETEKRTRAAECLRRRKKKEEKIHKTEEEKFSSSKPTISIGTTHYVDRIIILFSKMRLGGKAKLHRFEESSSAKFFISNFEL